MNPYNELELLARHIRQAIPSIVRDWSLRVDADPAVAAANQLTRAEFVDHIPAVLESLAERLATQGTDLENPQCDIGQVHLEPDENADAEQHGLHRWRQGYSLVELVREWGHLHVCLSQEMEAFWSKNAGTSTAAQVRARCLLTMLVNEEIARSVDAYHHSHQQTAEVVLHDLEETIGSFDAVQRNRGEILRAASHDLRGNLQLIMSTVGLLERDDTPLEKRKEIVSWLGRGVASLYSMMSDLMDLARLEAARESVAFAEMDAGQLLEELAEGGRRVAAEKNLTLNSHGPSHLIVESDRSKVWRISQNLLLNAIRYTPSGHVSLCWGPVNDDEWFIEVVDSGPGLGGTSAEGLLHLETADSGGSVPNQKRAAAKVAPSSTEATPGPAAGPVASGGPLHRRRAGAGEGVGLSIVQRLCNLLGAELSARSTQDGGSAFRIVFPVRRTDALSETTKASSPSPSAA